MLKEEFQGLAGPEIGAKIRSGVDVHKFVETPEVAYTGGLSPLIYLCITSWLFFGIAECPDLPLYYLMAIFRHN